MTKKPFFTAKRDSVKIGIFFLLLPAVASLIMFLFEINFVNSLKRFAGPLPTHAVFMNLFQFCFSKEKGLLLLRKAHLQNH